MHIVQAQVVFLAAVIARTATPPAYPGSQYQNQASISVAQARKVALHAVPGGSITGEELEKEAGGSGLRYSFDVKIAGVTHEVGVDARTGKLLEDRIEGSNPD